MAYLKTIAIVAIMTAVAGVSIATKAQAEERHGRTLPSRMMMKKHTTSHHVMSRRRM